MRGGRADGGGRVTKHGPLCGNAPQCRFVIGMLVIILASHYVFSLLATLSSLLAALVAIIGNLLVKGLGYYNI